MSRTSSRRGIALLVVVALVGTLALPAAAAPMDWLGQGRGALAALWAWWTGWFGVEKYGSSMDPNGLASAPHAPADGLNEGPNMGPNG